MSILETTGKVMDVAAMEQAKDIAASEEVGIYGLLREKKYIKRRDLVKSIHHRELPFPEPYQVAAHKLNVPWTVTNKAVMVQTAGCNLSCDYCFTGESVVVSATADDLWHDYWDLYCQKAENPSPIFRVSGGEPFLQQDFTADVARTMGSRRRYIEGLHVGSTGVYIWVDTNLTIKPSNYLLNSLNGDRIGVCGCWKPVSAPEKYETQLQVATQLLDAGVDTYFYYPASLDEEDKELLLDAEWDCQWSDIACRWSAEFLSHLHSASKNLGKYYASRLNPISIHYDYETVGGSEVFTAASAIKRDFFLRLQKKFIVMELGEEYWWMPDYMIDIRNGTSQ